MEGQTKRGSGVSGNLDELQGKMLARQRRLRLRSVAVGSLVLVAVVSGLGFAAVLLWQQAGSWRFMAGSAAPHVQTD